MKNSVKVLAIAAAVTLGVTRATGLAMAQEDASGGREFTSSGNVDPVRPEGGSAELQRRANLKELIATAPKTATGLPASNAGVAPTLMRPRASGAAAARNAIGVAIQGGQTARRNDSGFTVQAGTGTAGINTARANDAGAHFHRPAVPLNAGPPAVGAAINGAAMGHIASGPSSIGGPAKDRSGINGTSIRPRH